MRYLIGVMLCAWLSFAALAGPADVTLPKQFVHNDHQQSSGQPSQAQFEALAQQGLKHVINLRPDSELSFDERALVTKLGMQYHHIPIASGDDINSQNASALGQLLAKIGSETVLVHCASGNRVGALIAIDAHLNGASNKQAIAKGKQWGLTRLTPKVQTIINQQ